MKKLTIAILFAMLATPAKALDTQDASHLGSQLGKGICEAIWDGASTQKEALEMAIHNKLSVAELENLQSVLNVLESETDGEYEGYEGVSKAYLDAFVVAIDPCAVAYQELP
jgi:hypothetical protein